uniref:Uncharacterized protein n=8 Tax=Panicoideae TaxID=147369 RepID=K3YZN4_SETIT
STPDTPLSSTSTHAQNSGPAPRPPSPLSVLAVARIGSAGGGSMADWGPVVVGVVLFVLLSPGLLCELPGTHRHVDFGGFHTNGKAIFVHTLIFFAAFTILTLALHVHIYTG